MTNKNHCIYCVHSTMDPHNLIYTCEHPQAYLGETYKLIYTTCKAMRLKEGKCTVEGILFKIKDTIKS